MFIRLMLSICCLALAFSANAIRYEVLTKGSDLLIKEVDEFVLVGSDVLAPIKLPYKEAFTFLDANGSGYNLSSWANSTDISSWTRTDAIVFKGNFLDGYAGDEWFIQGKGITFSGGAKNAYVNGLTYIADTNHTYSSAIATASSSQLTMVTVGTKEYLQYNTTSTPTIRYRFGESYQIIAENIGSVQAASDETLIKAPVSSVTSAGTLTSSYPIEFPTAEGGLKPSLAISYMSNGPKNGVLGYGFALSGIETITHCPFNTDSKTGDYQKGNIVVSKETSQFCYNGIPLVPLDSNTGEAISTLSENNIPSTYALKNSPDQRLSYANDSFNLRLSNGAVKTFTRINDITWAMSILTNIHGESISYSYTNTASEILPAHLNEISWGGYSASFKYSDKRNDFDIEVDILGDNFFSKRKLLTDIEIKKQGISLSSQHIKYELLGGLSRYAINAIQSCGYIPLKFCSQPTVFQWSSMGQLVEISSDTPMSGDSEKIIKIKASKTQAEQIAYIDGNIIKEIDGTALISFPVYGGEELVQVYPHRENGMDTLYLLFKNGTELKTVKTEASQPVNEWVKTGGYTCASYFPNLDGNNPTSVIKDASHDACDTKFGSYGAQCNNVRQEMMNGVIYFGCDVPYVITNKVTYSWHKVAQNSSSTGWLSTTSKVLDGGCIEGVSVVPDSFAKSTPMLSMDQSSDGVQDVLLRTLTKNGAATTECIDQENEDDVQTAYAVYADGDTSFVESYHNLHIFSDGYEGTVNQEGSSVVSPGYRGYSSDNNLYQSDIDGNGISDYIQLTGLDSGSAVVELSFNAGTEWTGVWTEGGGGRWVWAHRLQSKDVDYALGAIEVESILPIDIDHDGIKEILYAQSGSIKYLKYRYNPIESAVNVSSHTLISSLGTVEKLLLADTNYDGSQELVVGLASSVKTFELSRRPVISQVDYGIYRDVITYDDSAVTLDSTNTSGQPVTKPTYQVVSKFQKQFKDSDDVYEDLSRVSYSYLNPAIHTQHGYSLGFEKITKTDEINLAKTETTYYQDVLQRGLVKNVLNQSVVYVENPDEIDDDDYKDVSKVENTYTQHSLHDLGLGLDESKKTSYIKGIASNYTKQTYDYDDYARVSSVNNQLYSSSNQLIKSNLVSTQYKNTSFSHSGGYDNLPSYVDSTLSIPAASLLINQRNDSGSKTLRKVYTESTTVPGTIEKVANGYLDSSSAFVQTSAEYVEQLAGNKGNASKTIQYGSVGDRSITTEYSSYVGSQPQTITVLNGNPDTTTSSITRSYDDLGRLLSETALNGSITSYTYDAFGRVLTLDSDRDDATYSYASCANDSACTSLPNSADIVWVSEVSWASGKKEYSYSDAQGRNVGQAWINAQGIDMYSWKTFDSRNRVSKEYLPCAQGGCAADSPHTAYSYEANSADRWQVKKTLADGSIVKTTIKAGSCATTLGSSSICVNASGTAVSPYYTQETLVDGKQPKLNTEETETPSTPSATTHKTYQVVDHAGNAFASVEGYGTTARAVVFSRDVMGNNTQVHQRFGNESTQELVRSYTYTDAGELESDTNAVGIKEEYRFNGHGDLLDSYVFGADGKLYGHDDYVYDSIGRLQSRESLYSNTGVIGAATNGSNIAGLNTARTFTYDYAGHQGISVPTGFACDDEFELCSESVTDTISGVNSYKNYSYTDDGLLGGKFETITDSNASVTKNAEFSYGYFPSGQLQTESLNGYEITHQYAYGQLTQMTDHHSETLWKLAPNGLAANGSVSEANILGTNELLYSTDVLGRNTVSTIQDANKDPVNSWFQGFNHVGTAAFRQSVSSAPKAENFEYDGFGQLDQTEMAGANPYDYTIDKWANLTARRGVNTDYSTLAADCATQMSTSGVNSLPARSGSNKWLASSRGSQQYCYDQLGRQAINGDNAIEYYVNGQAARIKNAQSDIRLGYDSQGTPNFEQQTSTDTTKNYTAWLFDGGRYEVRDDNGTLNTRIYPSHDIRVDYAGEGVGSTASYHYVLTDTMGSVLGLATKNGNALELTQQRGYTPFGEHRTPDNWNIISTADTGDAYGFTGQRHLPEFSLYQFVGRIYDTDQGRFTGPDPIVSQPGNWKNYNPYTYVYNDPMGWTDPSGWSGVSNQYDYLFTQDLDLSNIIFENTLSQSFMDHSHNWNMAISWGYDGSNNLSNDIQVALSNSGINVDAALASRIDGALTVNDSSMAYLELPLEVASLSIGATMFATDLYNGNYGNALISGAAFTADVFMTMAPGAPGVSSSVLSMARYGDEATLANSSVQGSRKFWVNSVNFQGSKVHQRNDLIDPFFVDGRGRSNLDRMQKGLAPIGPDGKSINLHHLTQRHSGSVAEMTQTFHQKNSKIIHINPNSVPSGIDRPAFNKWRTAYWKARANDF